jgi:plastocyanin
MSMRVFAALGLALGAMYCGAFSAQAYDVAPVSGGGAIKGKVTFNGTVPTRTVLPTKDPEVCGKVRKEDLIKVGADKGVQDAMLALQGVAKGKDWTAPAKPPEIDNKDCVFLPRTQVVRAGKMNVVNSDPVLHNTHGFYDKRTAFNLALPNKGQSIEVELPRPGTVRVECDSHGWMLGWIYVVDNPYYALSDASGNFEIKDIPPGKYQLIANQEAIGAMPPIEVEVKAGQTVDLPIELKK